MKISNKLFNDQQIRQFSRNMDDIQSVQAKISSGKNIIFASDDPVGAVQLSGLNDVKNREVHRKYKKYSEKIKKFTFGGRLADYAYYDMDMTISAALKKFSQTVT